MATAHLQLLPPAMHTQPLVNRMGSTRVLLLLLLLLPLLRATWAITIQPPLQVGHLTIVLVVDSRLTFYEDSNLCYDYCFLLWSFTPQECTPLGLTTWPHLLHIQGHLKTGPHRPRTGRQQHHLQVILFSSSHPCTCLCFWLLMSVSLHLSDGICLFLFCSYPESHLNHAIPPKKRGRTADVSSATCQKLQKLVSPLRLRPPFFVVFFLTPCGLECKQSHCGSSLAACSDVSLAYLYFRESGSRCIRASLGCARGFFFFFCAKLRELSGCCYADD